MTYVQLQKKTIQQPKAFSSCATMLSILINNLSFVSCIQLKWN